MKIQKTKKPKIKIGVEIECVYNGKIHSITAGAYQGNRDADDMTEKTHIPGMPGWESQRDGSLYTSYNLSRFATGQDKSWSGWKAPIEIISKVYTSKKKFVEGLLVFKKFMSKDGRYELNEVLEFNDSMGSHIHFSIDGFTFEKKTIFSIYPRVREYFFKKIKESNIKSKAQILEHYGRYYSRQITKDTWKESRYSEFNFESERQNRGLEWRSPNLLNITTWAEFFEFWAIAFDTCEFLGKCARKWEESDESLLIDERKYAALKLLESQKKTDEILEVYKPGRDKVRYSYIELDVKDGVVEIDANISIESFLTGFEYVPEQTIQLNLDGNVRR